MLKPNKSVNGCWLTDPTVPKARPVWATRKSRVRVKRAKAWIPEELTMWWDMSSGRVYYADFNEVTDFASTPLGDGHKGAFRGAGRLHDQMCEKTPVLVPIRPDAKVRLARLVKKLEGSTEPLSLIRILECGYIKAKIELTIWEAGMLYYRMLRSGGVNRVRAFAQRAGLRTLHAQHVYRWAWDGNQWEYESERE